MRAAVGDVVTYEAFGGEMRTGVVTAWHSDIKNGRAGFDLCLDEGGVATVWGYADQIVRVQRRGGSA